MANTARRAAATKSKKSNPNSAKVADKSKLTPTEVMSIVFTLLALIVAGVKWLIAQKDKRDAAYEARMAKRAQEEAAQEAANKAARKTETTNDDGTVTVYGEGGLLEVRGADGKVYDRYEIAATVLYAARKAVADAKKAERAELIKELKLQMQADEDKDDEGDDHTPGIPPSGDSKRHGFGVR